MKAGSFNNIIPPIPVYGGVGHPFKTSLSNLQNNIDQQNKLNNKHGGSKRQPKFKSKSRERRRRYYGGEPASVNERPTEIVVPQAPTTGSNHPSPQTGNSIAANASETLLKHSVNSEYDSDVVVPAIPKSQQGGRKGKYTPLLKRLEQLTRKRIKKGKRKTKRNVRHKKHFRKKNN